MFKFLLSHRFHFFVLYFLGLSIVVKNIYSGELVGDYDNSVSFLAIVSTFGASLTGVGVLLTGDYSRRILLNVDILFKDILKNPVPWRRWPFLKRKSIERDLNSNKIESELKNPAVPIDVGTHTIKICIPTVERDFFDLSVMKNLWKTIRYHSAQLTRYSSSNEAYTNDVFESSFDEHMAFKCLKDIWLYVFAYRFFRYLTHFGVSLCIYSFIFWFYLIWI